MSFLAKLLSSCTTTRVTIPLDDSTTPDDEPFQSSSWLATSEGTRTTCSEKFRNILYNLVMPMVPIIPFGIPLAMLIIGGMYFDDCPIEPLVPFLLIMGGSITFVHWSLKLAYKTGLLPGPEGQTIPIIAGQFVLIVFLNIVRMAMFSWVIVSAVFIFRLLGRVSDDRGSGDYCHPVLYKWAECSVSIIAVILAEITISAAIMSYCRRGQENVSDSS